MGFNSEFKGLDAEFSVVYSQNVSGTSLFHPALQENPGLLLRGGGRLTLTLTLPLVLNYYEI
jgi:hypothetical protein